MPRVITAIDAATASSGSYTLKVQGGETSIVVLVDATGSETFTIAITGYPTPAETADVGYDLIPSGTTKTSLGTYSQRIALMGERRVVVAYSSLSGGAINAYIGTAGEDGI